jgi:hypothetical protein
MGIEEEITNICCQERPATEANVELDAEVNAALNAPRVSKAHIHCQSPHFTAVIFSLWSSLCSPYFDGDSLSCMCNHHDAD